MIGDNRETDIVFGNNAGIATLCVLTGAATEDEIINSKNLGEVGMPMYYSKNLFE
jgi:ribonucleotide monophosphatase NagD (HAD superfamily)